MIGKAVLLWLCFLVFACSRGPESHLRWLEDADPVEHFQANAKKNRGTFYSVCSFACGFPGLNGFEYYWCFAEYADEEIIDPTGDMINSDEHMSLKTVAVEFAQTHNRLMADHLTESGLIGCDLNEDWDAATQAIEDLLTSQGHRNSTASLSWSGGDLQISVLTDVAVERRLHDQACSLIPDFGISRAARLNLTVRGNYANDMSLFCVDRQAVRQGLNK